MLLFRAVTAGIFALGMMVFPVLAQPVEQGSEGILADLVQPIPGSRVCFSRDYDDTHLRAHPAQMVRSMEFRVTYYAHDPDAFFPKGQRNYYFWLGVQMMDGKKLATVGECAPAEDGKTIRCGVEDDGGGILIRQAKTANTLLIDL